MSSITTMAASTAARAATSPRVEVDTPSQTTATVTADPPSSSRPMARASSLRPRIVPRSVMPATPGRSRTVRSVPVVRSRPHRSHMPSAVIAVSVQPGHRVTPAVVDCQAMPRPGCPAPTCRAEPHRSQ
jgi:hypothetical protein